MLEAAVIPWPDAIMAELTELRAEVTASLPAPVAERNGLDADTLLTATCSTRLRRRNGLAIREIRSRNGAERRASASCAAAGGL